MLLLGNVRRGSRVPNSDCELHYIFTVDIFYFFFWENFFFPNKTLNWWEWVSFLLSWLSCDVPLWFRLYNPKHSFCLTTSTFPPFHFKFHLARTLSPILPYCTFAESSSFIQLSFSILHPPPLLFNRMLLFSLCPPSSCSSLHSLFASLSIAF